MTLNKRIYIASPLGFTESGKFFLYEKIIPIFKECGLGVIDPWKLTPQCNIDDIIKMPYGTEKKQAWQKLNRIIGDNNRKGIEASDGLFAILDGADVDSGTASEIGFAYALGKTVSAYRGDFRNAGDNDGSVVNIQVEYFIYESGGTIVSNLDEIKKELQRIFISSFVSL